jgi:hypothetical protein
VRKFIENEKKYDPKIIRKRAKEFGEDIFKEKFGEFVIKLSSIK